MVESITFATFIYRKSILLLCIEQIEHILIRGTDLNVTKA